MRRFLRYRPSPVTIIVAIVSSLVFAGIAYANLPGRNSVISSDIAPRAVHNSDDATGSVNSRVIRNNSVTTTDIKDGTILLADMNPATIAALKGGPGGPGAPGSPGTPGAPGAPGATGAGGGAATKFFFTTDNGIDATVLTVGGFHLSETCGTTDMTTHFTSGADNSMLYTGDFFFNSVIFDKNFDNNEVDSLAPGGEHGTFQYVQRDGVVVAANYWASDGGDNFGGTQDCSLTGMADVG